MSFFICSIYLPGGSIQQLVFWKHLRKCVGKWTLSAKQQPLRPHVFSTKKISTSTNKNIHIIIFIYTILRKTTGTYWIHLYKLLNKKQIPSMKLTYPIYPSKISLESHTTLYIRRASAPHTENVEPNSAPARCVAIDGRQTKMLEFKGKDIECPEKRTCGTNKSRKHQKKNHLNQTCMFGFKTMLILQGVSYVCIKFHLSHRRIRQFTWSFWKIQSGGKLVVVFEIEWWFYLDLRLLKWLVMFLLSVGYVW